MFVISIHDLIILKSSPIPYPKSESIFTVLSNEAFCLDPFEEKKLLSFTAA